MEAGGLSLLLLLQSTMEDTTTHYGLLWSSSGDLHQQSAGYEAVTAMASVAFCCLEEPCLCRECLADHHGAALSLQMLPQPLSQR